MTNYDCRDGDKQEFQNEESFRLHKFLSKQTAAQNEREAEKEFGFHCEVGL
jgi:hypothetical protein